MVQDCTSRDNIQIGMSVEINPQRDRSRQVLVSGVVDEILTNSSHHPHGILVKLKEGETGRVKKILSSEVVVPDNNVKITSKKKNDFGEVKNIKDLLIGGENHFLEFKSSALWSTKLTDHEINEGSVDMKQQRQNFSKFIIAKSLAAFLNSDGGNLIIGIKENKNVLNDEIVGIEPEFAKLADPCKDGYRRMVVDQIIKPYLPPNIFNQINNYIMINFEEIDGRTLCILSANKSDEKVFLRSKNRDRFFVRVDATTREIHGEQVVDYCFKRFSQ